MTMSWGLGLRLRGDDGSAGMTMSWGLGPRLRGDDGSTGMTEVRG
ncbi:MAG: hypothetical protein ABNH21_14565 [Glaciecola sp.]